ncbi:MAG: TraR/DksA C4-type zinc finger protein [Smithellaceae bacterium]
MPRQKSMERLRDLMVQKMDALRQSADSTICQLKVVDEKFADPFDQAVIESSNSVELKCRTNDWQALLDVKETILRIDRGLHGMCDLCGRQISQKRLRAAPMSKLCFACQEEKEAESRQRQRRNYPQGRISYSHA